MYNIFPAILEKLLAKFEVRGITSYPVPCTSLGGIPFVAARAISATCYWYWLSNQYLLVTRPKCPNVSNQVISAYTGCDIVIYSYILTVSAIKLEPSYQGAVPKDWCPRVLGGPKPPPGYFWPVQPCPARFRWYNAITWVSFIPTALLTKNEFYYNRNT